MEGAALAALAIVRGSRLEQCVGELPHHHDFFFLHFLPIFLMPHLMPLYTLEGVRQNA